MKSKLIVAAIIRGQPMLPFMTLSDYSVHLSGYYPSHWPAECAGPRRQKITRSPGLNIQPGETLTSTMRIMDDNRWPVMFVLRDPGEVYLQGGTIFGPASESYGWVEKIDPISLAPLRRSPNLPTGGHKWCGAACVHENGDIYIVNGSYCHRLSPDLEIVAEQFLSTDNAHNGHVVMSDGNLITKDISDKLSRPAIFTVLDPDLHIIDRFECPWNSVGRFSSDRVGTIDYLYVTNSTHVHRLIYNSGKLSLDQNWSASYMVDGNDQGYAWDTAVGDDNVWFMDMGESANSKRMLDTTPTGTGEIKMIEAPIHSSPIRVHRISVHDSSDRDAFVPFGSPNAHIVSPPLYDQDRHILVAFDTTNGGIGGWRYQGPGNFTPLWKHDWRNVSQLTMYADTGELIVDHVLRLGEWDAVVIDIETGLERARVATDCFMPSGMWYTPGFARDFYASTQLGRIARISVKGE